MRRFLLCALFRGLLTISECKNRKRLIINYLRFNRVPRTDWWRVKIGKNRKVNCCVFDGWALEWLLFFADICSRCATSVRLDGMGVAVESV